MVLLHTEHIKDGKIKINWAWKKRYFFLGAVSSSLKWYDVEVSEKKLNEADDIIKK